jgi:hypothetical protein
MRLTVLSPRVQVPAAAAVISSVVTAGDYRSGGPVTDLPGYRTHLLIGLVLTYELGRWLVIEDQNTRVEDG